MKLNSLIALGKKQFEEKDYRGAKETLIAVEKGGGHYPDVLYILALSHHYLGELQDAVGKFEEALALNPLYVEASIGLSITLNDMGKYSHAREAFDKAFESLSRKGRQIPLDIVKPRIVGHLRELGKLYASINRYDEAKEHVKRALEIAPDYPDLKEELARILRDGEEFEEAKVCLMDLVEQNPTSVSALLNLGLICYLEGNIEESRLYWEKAHSLEPMNKLTLMYLNTTRET